MPSFFDHYENNLRILQRRDLKLARYVAGLRAPDNIRVLPSKSGLPILVSADTAGREHLLHSPNNPADEATRLINGHAFANEDATLLLGCGLLYLVQAIAKEKRPHHHLFVVEGIPEIFGLAMRHLDLSIILNDPSIFILLGDDVQKLLNGFPPLDLKAISGNIHKLALPNFMALYNDRYNDIEKRIHDHVTSVRLSFNTFLKHRDLLLKNTFKNIPAFIDASTTAPLKGILKGTPALVVAAGPSLSQEIGTLKKTPSSCFLICVDTALRPLLNNGIQPNLVVTCDPISANVQKLKGLSAEDLGSTPLLFRADAQTDMVNRFSGMKFVVDSDTTVSKWLTNIGRAIHRFPHYQTVSHLGFLAARFMGANPIIFVGLDLSFPTDDAHADGCTTLWNIKENMGFKQVPNNTDGTVKTIEQFVSMIHLFQEGIKQTSARCINVSKEGALIRGAEWMPLKKVFAEIPSGACDNSLKQRLIKAYTPDTMHLRAEYRKALSWMISEVEILNRHCRRAEAAINSQITNNKDDSDRQKEVVDIYHATFQHTPLLNIVSDYLHRYLLSFNRVLETGVPKIDAASTANSLDPITLFCEELSTALPVVDKLSRNVLEKIDCS